MDGTGFSRFRLFDVFYGKIVLKRFFLYYLPFFLYAILLIFLSHLSNPKTYISETDFLHYPEFAIFSFLLIRLLDNLNKEISIQRKIFFTLFFSIVFAISDEIHQAFIPKRTPELLDLFRDLIGSISGIIIYAILKRMMVRKW